MAESFVFYKSFYDAMSDVAPSTRNKVYAVLIEYAITGKVPNLTGNVSAFFKLMRPQIDANTRRRENGRLGGKPYGGTDRSGLYDGSDEDKTDISDSERYCDRKQTKSEPDLNREQTKPEPDLNRELTKPEPDLNLELTKSEPDLNRELTKSEPDLNRELTKPEPNVNVNANVNANANANKDAGRADAPTAKAAAAHPQKHKYGEHRNVALTSDELDKLKALYPSDWPERVEQLSSYIAHKGAVFKSHYLTIINRAKRGDEMKTREEPDYFDPARYADMDLHGFRRAADDEFGNV